MRDLDLTSLRLFVAVCETRNIARAGEQENIVGSAISKRLMQLEDTVGTTLLVRQRHGVTPTAAGETLLEHARGMLAISDRIHRDMSAFGMGIRGHVTVLGNVSSIAESLPDDVASFLKQPAHKHIQIDIEERLSKDVVRGVKEGSASLGVCWDTVDFDGLQSRPYREDHLSVVIYPAHPLFGRKNILFDEALAYDHVTLPPSTAVQVMLRRAAAAKGKTMSCRAVVSTFDAALRVVHSGLAISVVPVEIANQYLDLFDLYVIPLQDPWAQRRFSVCYRDEKQLSPAALLLMEHLATVQVGIT